MSVMLISISVSSWDLTVFRTALEDRSRKS